MFTANCCLVTALALLVSASSLHVAHASSDDTTYTASWDSKAHLPEKRSDMTASTVGKKIYIIGGCNEHQVRPQRRCATGADRRRLASNSNSIHDPLHLSRLHACARALTPCPSPVPFPRH